MSQPTMNDPAEAKDFFNAKLDFTLGPVDLDSWMKNDEMFTIVDVRAAEDFAKGHIPGAVNLPKDKWESLTGLQKGQVNVVYCYGPLCHLAARAAVEFASNGFSVMEMEGGMEAWREGGYDVEAATSDTSRQSGQTESQVSH